MSRGLDRGSLSTPELAYAEEPHSHQLLLAHVHTQTPKKHFSTPHQIYVDVYLKIKHSCAMFAQCLPEFFPLSTAC